MDGGSAHGYGSRPRTFPRARIRVAHRLATRLGRRLIDWGTTIRVDVDYAEHGRLHAEVRARDERERAVEVMARMM